MDSENCKTSPTPWKLTKRRKARTDMLVVGIIDANGNTVVDEVEDGDGSAFADYKMIVDAVNERNGFQEFVERKRTEFTFSFHAYTRESKGGMFDGKRVDDEFTCYTYEWDDAMNKLSEYCMTRGYSWFVIDYFTERESEI